MNIIIINNGSKHIKKLETLFEGCNTRVVKLESINLRFISNDTLVVISGGRSIPVLWHDKYYSKELDIIKNHKGPVLGICLGFELIAHAYGSHLSLLPVRIHRKSIIEPTDAGSALFKNKRYCVAESHRWGLKKVSKPLVALARSKTAIEIIKHADKPIFGVQFHLENCKGNDGREIFDGLMLAISTYYS